MVGATLGHMFLFISNFSIATFFLFLVYVLTSLILFKFDLHKNDNVIFLIMMVCSSEYVIFSIMLLCCTNVVGDWNLFHYQLQKLH
jgi:hypothetical protein